MSNDQNQESKIQYQISSIKNPRLTDAVGQAV
jgi:hypothetical protein